MFKRLKYIVLPMTEKKEPLELKSVKLSPAMVRQVKEIMEEIGVTQFTDIVKIALVLLILAFKIDRKFLYLAHEKLDEYEREQDK